MFKLCIKYDRINYFFSSLCIENETIAESDCQECMFDLFVEAIRVGPGSSYLESVFPWLTGGAADIDVFLKASRYSL